MVRLIQPSAWLLIISFIPFSAMAGVEACVDPDDGGCFPTIQSAVDAAIPGSIISVRAKADGSAYNESVVVNTAGLTIQGDKPPVFDIEDFEDLLALDWDTERNHCPGVKVDACETAALGDSCGFYTHPTASDDERTAFVINAANVTIRHFTIRHAYYGIRFHGGSDGGDVDLNCFIRAKRAIFAGNDGGPTVDDIGIRANRLFGVAFPRDGNTNSSFLVYGENTLVERNLLQLSEGIFLDGTSTTVQINAIDTTTSDPGIRIHNGTGHVVSENWVVATANSALRFNGISSSTVSNNLLTNVPDDNDGVELASSSSGNTISGNTIRGISEHGIVIFGGGGNTVQSNTVSNVGGDRDQACIRLSGIDQQILTNDLTLCNHYGIRVPGESTDTVISGNQVQWSQGSGIQLAGPDINTTVDSNILTNNHGEGFSQSAVITDSHVTNNTATGNRTDICNDGAFSTFTGNVFVTGGSTTPCVRNK